MLTPFRILLRVLVHVGSRPPASIERSAMHVPESGLWTVSMVWPKILLVEVLISNTRMGRRGSWLHMPVCQRGKKGGEAQSDGEPERRFPGNWTVVGLYS
jgi:hypothetical protein